MQITSEPLCSDPCARLKIQIPMHSVSWGCPKIVRHCDPVSLLINIFGIHLKPGCKSHEQIHYRTAKNVQKQATVLLYFLDEFLWIDPGGISSSLTCTYSLSRWQTLGRFWSPSLRPLLYVCRQSRAVIFLCFVDCTIGVVPKELLTFLGSLYKEIAKTTSGT